MTADLRLNPQELPSPTLRTFSLFCLHVFPSFKILQRVTTVFNRYLKRKVLDVDFVSWRGCSTAWIHDDTHGQRLEGFVAFLRSLRVLTIELYQPSVETAGMMSLQSPSGISSQTTAHITLANARSPCTKRYIMSLRQFFFFIFNDHCNLMWRKTLCWLDCFSSECGRKTRRLF